MKTCWRLIVLALAVALTSCGAEDKPIFGIIDLLSRPYTTCIGRFFIALPEGMENVSPNSGVTLYYGLGTDFKTVEVAVESVVATPASLATGMEAKATKIGQDDNWQTQKSMLLEHKVVNDHAVYLRYWSALEGAIGQKRELHLLMGNTQLLLQAESYEGVQGDYESGEQVDARLARLASQIRLYDDPQRAGPGFCLGPVVIDSDNDEEQADITLHMRKHPDLRLSVYSKGLTPDAEDKSLLERSSDLLSRTDVHVLRKGMTSMGGMKADEVLIRGRDIDHDNVRILMFTAESQRADPSLGRPKFSLALNAGGQLTSGQQQGAYVDASLTDDQAIALWDAIVASLQLRPHAVRDK